MSFARHPRGGRPPSAARNGGRIVFHADDFGMNGDITEGILRGFQHGLLTSTSLLTNAPDAARAIREWQRLQLARASGNLPSAAIRRELLEPQAPFELGLHINLTQGRPLTPGYPRELLDEHGRFVGIGRLFASLRRKCPQHESALFAELSAQLEFLFDHAQRPTHVNGHQYIELLPGLRPIIRELIVRHQIPALRLAREPGLLSSALFYDFRPSNWCLAHVKRFYADRFEKEACAWGVTLPQAFFGTSHAGRINLELVRRYLQSAGGCQLIEIGVHPATDSHKDPAAQSRQHPKSDSSPEIASESGWSDPLAALRPQELGMLTSPLLAELVQEFGLSLGRLVPFQAEAATRAA
jgi:predicted glycoside hydrolase/deacetylase ChbG (UPF0249 family)